MATEEIGERAEHVRSVGVTALTSLAGILAAVGSYWFTAIREGLPPEEAALAVEPVILVVIAIGIQFPLLKLSGIYGEDEFGIKHYLFIAFMTFAMWFVAWGILLTAAYTA